MARIAVDMDEVIADFNAKFIATFNARGGRQISVGEMAGKAFHSLLPEMQEEVLAMIGAEGVFADLPVMPDSQDVLARMSKRHEIFITTAAMEFPACFNDKFSWLKEHFPFISPMNVVFCGSKSIINADYLIDDNSHHFAHFRGEGILYSAPHNLYVEGFTRVRNWQEVGAMFL